MSVISFLERSPKPVQRPDGLGYGTAWFARCADLFDASSGLLRSGFDQNQSAIENDVSIALSAESN
jgi:hypothetical protein